MRIVLLCLLLTGCSHYKHSVQMKDLYIDNSVNNFSGNPCTLWLNDRCIIVKPTPRDPERTSK
jgi:hypothetical protein